MCDDPWHEDAPFACAAAPVSIDAPLDATSRIAVIGAGLAGLTAAFVLARCGMGCTVYEASDRVGGRVHSNSAGYWAEEQTSEWCGELIDSDHHAVQALARTFGLRLTDLLAAEAPGSSPTYFFDGSYYPRERAEEDFRPVREALQRDLRAAGTETTWRGHTVAGRALDATSVHDWIESRVAGGHASPLGKLLDAAYEAEFAASTADQSALNIVYTLGFQPESGGFALLGESDERHRIEGGNEQLPRALASCLPDAVRFGWRLRSCAANDDGTVALRFDVGGAAEDVVADHVVLAIPFAALRTLDLEHAGLDDVKRAAIARLGSGRSVKLALQFRERHWSSAGPWGTSNGSSFSDTGYGSTWEATRGQSGACGILVSFSAGAGAAALSVTRPFAAAAADAAVRAHARALLDRLEPVYAGLGRRWNGRATLSVPMLDPHLRCSYPYYRVGQYTEFGGSEGVRQGNLHFAGDHCSQRFQGFMEGAVREGDRAAREILADLGRG